MARNAAAMMVIIKVSGEKLLSWKSWAWSFFGNSPERFDHHHDQLLE
jgi:hypothetical protein